MCKFISATTRDKRLLYLALGLAITTNLACEFYASVHARGLYADAAALLVVIYEGNWFFLSLSSPRAMVEILRQTPIVLLTKDSSATLFQCGQALTFVMLALPTLLCALCWPIAPRGDKGWILFPIAFLLIGFAATSMHAVGEAGIATSYFWVLLFLLLFRTRTIGQQGLFLLLCIPALRLHEGAFPLTATLLLALILRVHAAVGTAHERLFVGLASLLLAMILAYQIDYVIFPQFPGDRAHILYGLTHFEFVYADDRFNLPLITGALALLTLFAIAGVNAALPSDGAARFAKILLAAWSLMVLAAIVVATTIETSFSPLAQAQSRYHPVFVSAGLGTAMILLRRFHLPDRIWKNSATLLVLISLCAAQTATDIEATRHWNGYITDLQTTLSQERGLIPWETRLSVANRRVQIDWRAFEIAWTIPYICIIFTPDGVVNSIIDLPGELTFRPLDPERPDRLPKLSGIDFAPYRRYYAAQRMGNSP
jgi:hypothetical protein